MGKCIDCNYYINNSCCLLFYKIHCENYSLWTPKGYIRGLRADLSILDDHSGISQETVNEVCKSFIERR